MDNETLFLHVLMTLGPPKVVGPHSWKHAASGEPYFDMFHIQLVGDGVNCPADKWIDFCAWMRRQIPGLV